MSQLTAVCTFLMLSSTFANKVIYPRHPRFGLLRYGVVSRATAYSLRLEAICEDHKCLQQPQWHLKGVQSDMPAENGSTAVGQVVTFENLTPSTLYSVNVATEYKSMEFTALTCKVEAPRVEELRVVSSGYGWLEVRWRQPMEECRSEMKYLLAYGPMGPHVVKSGSIEPFPVAGVLEKERSLRTDPLGPPAPLQKSRALDRLGVPDNGDPPDNADPLKSTDTLVPMGPIGSPSPLPRTDSANNSGPFWPYMLPHKLPSPRELKMVRGESDTLRPVHPCPTWPKDFCVLLVDNVEPKEVHIIEVRAQRVDGLPAERSPLAVTRASAKDNTPPQRNPNFGWSMPGPGWRRPGTAADRDGTFCAMWSGVAIGTAAATLLVAFAVAIITVHRKKRFYAARKAHTIAIEQARALVENCDPPSYPAVTAEDNSGNRQTGGNEHTPQDGGTTSETNREITDPTNSTPSTSNNGTDTRENTTKSATAVKAENT